MQNVLEMAVLGKSASQETHLLTYLVSQTKCGKCRDSAIFQMTIIIGYTCIYTDKELSYLFSPFLD